MTAQPPFFAEHVGSLLRPDRLLKARMEAEGNQYEKVSGKRRFETLRELEDETILEAIALQEAVGLRVATDGEFRRRSWYQDFVLSLTGTAISFLDPKKATSVALPFRDDSTVEVLPAHIVHVTGKLQRNKSVLAEDFKYLLAHTKLVPKVSIPSPTIIHYWGGRAAIDTAAYPDIDQFWDDVVAIWTEEIRELHKLGCRYIQLDEVTLPMLCDPDSRTALQRRGDEPLSVLSKYSEVISRISKASPDDMTVGVHMCRGNNRGKWMASGGYDYIGEVALGTIDIDAFFLEYDSDRSGNFEQLKHVPKSCAVVLGLISTKTPILEAKDDLKRRISEAAEKSSLEQLRLSPQCGFASNFMGNPLTADDQRRKLELVVEVAEEVWGR